MRNELSTAGVSHPNSDAGRMFSAIYNNSYYLLYEKTFGIARAVPKV